MAIKIDKENDRLDWSFINKSIVINEIRQLLP